VAAALLDAAETIVDTDGVGGLSVRAVAERGGTTTRAVYTLFGSKAGLLAALGARAFDLLRVGVQSVDETDDPAADLIDAAIEVFRNLAVTRQGLYRIGVQQTAIDPDVVGEFRPAALAAFQALEARFARLSAAGRLVGRSLTEAACQFDALCEGLAALEHRRGLPPDNAEQIWRAALATLLAGLATPLPVPEVPQVG
jgi:AcrR family transcriptional regulator